MHPKSQNVCVRGEKSMIIHNTYSSIYIHSVVRKDNFCSYGDLKGDDASKITEVECACEVEDCIVRLWGWSFATTTRDQRMELLKHKLGLSLMWRRQCQTALKLFQTRRNSFKPGESYWNALNIMKSAGFFENRLIYAWSHNCTTTIFNRDSSVIKKKIEIIFPSPTAHIKAEQAPAQKLSKRTDI